MDSVSQPDHFSPALIAQSNPDTILTWLEYLGSWLLAWSAVLICLALGITAVRKFFSLISLRRYGRIENRTFRARRRAAKIAPESETPRSTVALSYSPPANLEAKYSARTWQKERARHLEIPGNLIRKWARRDYRMDMREDRVLSLFRSVLGSKLLTATAAAALVFLIRPSTDVSVWLQDAYNAVTAWLSDTNNLKYLPLLVVIVGMTAVSRRSPIVDRIRARDEAAKEANKLLTELFGALERFNAETEYWLRRLENTRSSLVRAEVRRATKNAYDWDNQGGLRRDTATYPPNDASTRPTAAPAPKLEAALADLWKVNEAIVTKGLRTVTWRLTSRVWLSIWELQLLRPPTAGASLERDLDYLRGQLCIDDRIAASARNLDFLVSRMSAVDRDIGQAFPDDADETVEDFAYSLAEAIDEALMDGWITLFHSNRVALFLNGRLAGSWWTRMIGAFHK